MRHLDEVIEYVPEDVKQRSHLAPPESGLGAQYWGQDLLGLEDQYWGQDLLGMEFVPPSSVMAKHRAEARLGFAPPASVMARHRAGAKLGEEIMMIEGVLNMAPTELEGAIFGASLEGLDDLAATVAVTQPLLVTKTMTVPSNTVMVPSNTARAITSGGTVVSSSLKVSGSTIYAPTTIVQAPSANSIQPTTRVQTIPTVPTTMYTPTSQIAASSVPQATINSLEKTVADRRKAIVKADTEAQKQYGRVKTYDAMLQKPLPASEKVRVSAARDIAAAKAVRYGKTAAVGQALTKNATAQVALLKLAKVAESVRQPENVQTLVQAAYDIGKVTKAIKAEREKQVEKFQAAAATEKVKFASLRMRQTARDYNDAQRQGASENSLLTLKTMTNRYRDALVKAKQEAGRAGIDPNLILEEYERDAIDSQAVVAALYGLDGNIFTKATNWVGDKAGDVKNAADKAYDAAKDFVKDTVCSIASNPAVKNAAMQATYNAVDKGLTVGAGASTGGAGAVVAGQASAQIGMKAGETAGKAVDALAKAACPKEEALPPTVVDTFTPGPRVLTLSTKHVEAAIKARETSMVLPVVIVGGAAAAAFLLL